MDQLLDEHLDEEEEEDPDCVNDPLYQLNLKVRLLSCFKKGDGMMAEEVMCT